MKNTLSQIISIIVFLSATTNWAADAPKADSLKTKIEQFSARHGTLTLRAEFEVEKLSYYKTGDFDFGDHDFNQVLINVVELIDPSVKQRAYGVTFKLSGHERSGTVSSLDEDELPSLIKGIDYLLELDPNVTKLAEVTGYYRTRDGMEVLVVKGSREVFAIKAKAGGFAVFKEGAAGLKKFRNAIVAAQALIKGIKP